MNTESVNQQGVLNSYKIDVDARMIYGFAMKADGKSEAYPLGKHNGPSSLIDKVLHTSNETASLPKYCPKVRGRSHEDKSPSLHVPPQEHKEEQSEEHKDVRAVQVLADRVHNNKHLVIMKARLKKKPELDETENDRIKLAFERYKQSKRQKGYSRIASHSPLYYNSNRITFVVDHHKKIKGYLIKSKEKLHPNIKILNVHPKKEDVCREVPTSFEKLFESKRSRSKANENAIKINDGMQLDYPIRFEPQTKQCSNQDKGSSESSESHPNQESSSSAEEQAKASPKKFQRRSTMPVKELTKLTEHHFIHNRKDFEEAINWVFDEAIAHKSLGKEGRLNEDILLDNHAFRSKTKRDKKDEHPYETFEEDFSSKARSSKHVTFNAGMVNADNFVRSSSHHTLERKSKCVGKFGNSKKLIIKIAQDSAKNIKI